MDTGNHVKIATISDPLMDENGNFIDDVKCTAAERRIISRVIDLHVKDDDAVGQDLQNYLREDLVRHIDIMYDANKFNNWLRKKQVEVKHLFRYDLNIAEVLQFYHDNIKTQPKEEMAKMFKIILAKRKEDLKEVVANKSLSPEYKAKKIAQLEGMIKNLNGTIGNLLAVQQVQMNKTR